MAELYRDLDITPGVEPSTDSTPQSTPHYTYSDKIRFVDGRPQKIGGWNSFSFDSGNTLMGAVRTVYSFVLTGSVQYLFGTSGFLYHLTGTTLTNITPLVTNTTAIANSLATYYIALGSNPITTVNGSNTITITDTATKVRAGDTIVLSGASTTNGIPNTEINASHFVRSQTTDSFTVNCTTTASSSGSGGGASVILKTGIITVSQSAHGFGNGYRVKIAAAADTGGILATNINKEFIIRNISTNAYDIVTTGSATSSVSGGGGSSATVQGQIAAGNVNAFFGSGYGLGQYGVGLYGTPKTSSVTFNLPRIWSFDRFGNNIVMTPGSQTGVYTWDGNTTAAPTLVTNAPTAVNFVFVSNEILATQGASGVTNRLQASDQGSSTTWTTAITNQAYQNDIEGANTWIAAAHLQGINVMWTTNQFYTFSYIRRPLIWQVTLIEEGVGICAQNAHAVHDGIVYWMGRKNFYMYRGAGVEIIPSNTSAQTTMRRYVFDNINVGQISKSFAWYNREFNEIWFHYPSTSSNEPDSIARVNLSDFTWAPDTMDRTGAEGPGILGTFPYLVSSANLVYQHETGHDADGVAMPFSLIGPYYFSGLERVKLAGIVPDSIQTGNISIQVNIKNYAQASIAGTKGPYTITPTTNIIEFQTEARYWQWQISGSDLGQDWKAGSWQERIEQNKEK